MRMHARGSDGDGHAGRHGQDAGGADSDGVVLAAAAAAAAYMALSTPSPPAANEALVYGPAADGRAWLSSR